MEVMEPDVSKWNKRIVTIMQVESPISVENSEAIALVHGTWQCDGAGISK